MDKLFCTEDIKLVEVGKQRFIDYYKVQGIVCECEWDDFMKFMDYPLSITFRIVQATTHTDYIRKKIRYYRDKLLEQGIFIKELEWYRHGDGYSLSVSRADLRSNHILKELHQFLVNESNVGLIFRQEAVSMIPPLFLDLDSDHVILDMCASPGSKTSQVVEGFHKLAHNLNPNEPLPSGAIIANDVNSRRAHLLIHNLRHLHSPFLMVTNHPAQRFPSLFDPQVSNFVRYDSVMCDVPCTADGTIRKAPGIWKRWHPHDGIGAHRLQVQILRRGIELCKIGGKIIYSTCSLNPLENEAVIAFLIESGQGSIEVLDKKLGKEIKCSNGISTWKVYWDGTWYCSHEDLPETIKNSKKLPKSCFPPKELDLSYLKNCQRYFPHHNDTGGFFVAILRKIKEVPWVKDPYQPKAEQEYGEPSKHTNPRIMQTDYFSLSGFSSSLTGADIWASICNNYGLNSITSEETLNYWYEGITYKPSDNRNSLNKKKTDEKKSENPHSFLPRKLWYAEKGVRHILFSTTRTKFCVLLSGCVFSQSSTSNFNQLLKPCSYRLQHGAIDWMIRNPSELIGPQVVNCDFQTFLLLLDGQNPQSDHDFEEYDIMTYEQSTLSKDQKSSHMSENVGNDIIGEKKNLQDENSKEKMNYRIPISTLKYPCKLTFENCPQETPLLIKCPLLQNLTNDSCFRTDHKKSRHILIPVWKGRSNLELMISEPSRFALSWLIH